MRKLHGIQLFIISILLIGCNFEHQYFNGVVNNVDMPNNVDTLYGTEVKLNDVFAGSIYAYDSMLFFLSSKYKEEFLRVFSVNSGNLIGSLVSKGGGPSEAASSLHFKQYCDEEGGLKLWMCINSYKIIPLDILKSIKNQGSVFDSIRQTVLPKYLSPTPFLYIFMLDSSRIMLKSQAREIYKSSDDYIPGKYYIYNVPRNKVEKTFTLFKKPLKNKLNSKIPLFPKEMYFGSYDVIKPDRSKIAMAMAILGQINILDCKTGELCGYRIRKSPNYEYLKKDYRKFISYYQFINCDNDFIYIGYNGNLYGDGIKNKVMDHVYVFNWKGEFVNRIYLNKPFSCMTLDPINRIIYTTNEKDELFKFDLKDILNKSNIDLRR